MSLDLTKHAPRSPFDELGGFPWLPRLVDKARAMNAGTLGEYAPYPCPGDKGFLGHFGLDATALGALIKSGASDEEIGAWAVANASKGSEASKAAYRKDQAGPHGNPIFTLAAKFIAWKNRAEIAKNSPTVDRGSLNSIPKVIAAEEGHPLLGR